MDRWPARPETAVLASRDASPTAWRTSLVPASACLHHTPVDRLRDRALQAMPAFSNHATPALITPCSADRSHATRLIQWGRCESAPPTTFLSALS